MVDVYHFNVLQEDALLAKDNAPLKGAVGITRYVLVFFKVVVNSGGSFVSAAIFNEPLPIFP